MTLLLKDFMCVCTDEPRARAEKHFQEVCDALDCGPDTLLSRVVYNMTFNLSDQHYAAIRGIAGDMWCAVNATVYREQSGDYIEHAKISVQCDRVEHGIARVWQLAHEAVMLEVVDG